MASGRSRTIGSQFNFWSCSSLEQINMNTVTNMRYRQCSTVLRKNSKNSTKVHRQHNRITAKKHKLSRFYVLLFSQTGRLVSLLCRLLLIYAIRYAIHYRTITSTYLAKVGRAWMAWQGSPYLNLQLSILLLSLDHKTLAMHNSS